MPFKYFLGYCCGSSWKTQWEKRKLRWFFNYWPMGSSHSSPSRYGFSFCYVSSYDSCVELGRLSLVLFRFCTLTVIRTIKSVFLLSSSSIFASFICFSWTLELSAIILLILLCSPFIQDLKSNTWKIQKKKSPIRGISFTMYCHLHGLLRWMVWIFATDRLSTGFAVADIDLSKVEAVRTKMPLSEVTMSQASSV
jgi:hypothetical protein